MKVCKLLSSDATKPYKTRVDGGTLTRGVHGVAAGGMMEEIIAVRCERGVSDINLRGDNVAKASEARIGVGTSKHTANGVTPRSLLKNEGRERRIRRARGKIVLVRNSDAASEGRIHVGWNNSGPDCYHPFHEQFEN